jgi:hypothetical protein
VPNIVGMGLAIAGLVIFIAGVISGALVVPIVVGLYLIGALATPRPRGIALNGAGSELDAGRLTKALDQIAAQSSKRLPVDLAAKVEAICATVRDVLPRLGTTTIPREDLFTIERTVTDYLPTSLNSYLTLPRTYANTRVVRDGRTANQILGEQLDIIDEKMREVADAVARDDVGKLLAQGRFLAERFRGNDELSIDRQPSG